MVKRTDSVLSHGHTNGDLAKPTPLFCCSAKGHSFVCIAKGQLLYVGCPVKRKRKQNKNPILISSVRVRLRQCLLTGMCVNTEFLLEGKMGN